MLGSAFLWCVVTAILGFASAVEGMPTGRMGQNKESAELQETRRVLARTQEKIECAVRMHDATRAELATLQRENKSKERQRGNLVDAMSSKTGARPSGTCASFSQSVCGLSDEGRKVFDEKRRLDRLIAEDTRTEERLVARMRRELATLADLRAQKERLEDQKKRQEHL